MYYDILKFNFKLNLKLEKYMFTFCDTKYIYFLLENQMYIFNFVK